MRVDTDSRRSLTLPLALVALILVGAGFSAGHFYEAPAAEIEVDAAQVVATLEPVLAAEYGEARVGAEMLQPNPSLLVSDEETILRSAKFIKRDGPCLVFTYEATGAEERYCDSPYVEGGGASDVRVYRVARYIAPLDSYYVSEGHYEGGTGYLAKDGSGLRIELGAAPTALSDGSAYYFSEGGYAGDDVTFHLWSRVAPDYYAERLSFTFSDSLRIEEIFAKPGEAIYLKFREERYSYEMAMAGTPVKVTEGYLKISLPAR